MRLKVRITWVSGTKKDVPETSLDVYLWSPGGFEPRPRSPRYRFLQCCSHLTEVNSSPPEGRVFERVTVILAASS